MEDLRTTLIKHGFRFKKQFGQNFISDTNLLKSIVAASGIGGEDTAVEIGCGAGTLTRALAEVAKRVYAFDIDADLKPVLAETLSGLDNVEVIFRDFNKLDLPAFEREIGAYTVVANLPYYITTPLVTKLLEESELCKGISVMVQEEVAERFCARENTPEYGAITAAIALKGSAKNRKESASDSVLSPSQRRFRGREDFFRTRPTAREERKDVPRGGKKRVFQSEKDPRKQSRRLFFSFPRNGQGDFAEGGNRRKGARGDALARTLGDSLRRFVRLYKRLEISSK